MMPYASLEISAAHTRAGPWPPQLGTRWSRRRGGMILLRPWLGASSLSAPREARVMIAEFGGLCPWPQMIVESLRRGPAAPVSSDGVRSLGRRRTSAGFAGRSRWTGSIGGQGVDVLVRGL